MRVCKAGTKDSALSVREATSQLFIGGEAMSQLSIGGEAMSQLSIGGAR